jgi:transcriptional regulator with XRE-family HTH domain
MSRGNSRGSGTDLQLLGSAIRRQREQQGISQQKLAERAQLSLRFVSAVENGQNLTVDVLQRVMKALGMKRVQIGGIRIELGHERQRLLDLIDALSPESQKRLTDFLAALTEDLNQEDDRIRKRSGAASTLAF